MFLVRIKAYQKLFGFSYCHSNIMIPFFAHASNLFLQLPNFWHFEDINVHFLFICGVRNYYNYFLGHSSNIAHKHPHHVYSRASLV